MAGAPADSFSLSANRPSSTLALAGRALALGARWPGPLPDGLYLMSFVSGNTSTGQDSWAWHTHTCSHEHGSLAPWMLPNSFYRGPDATLEGSVLIWGCWFLSAGCAWSISSSFFLWPGTAQEKTGHHCTQVPALSLHHCPTERKSTYRRKLSPFYFWPSRSFIRQQKFHPYWVASRTWGHRTL